jgi:cytochrome P450
MTESIPRAAPGIAPGPPGLPLLGNVRAFQGDALEGFQALRRNYGDVVRLSIAGKALYLLFGANEARTVLQDHNKLYLKGRGLAKAKPLLGEGLLTSEGDFWRSQRRLIQPVFNRNRIEDFGPDMVAVTGEMLSRWDGLARAGEPVNVAKEMMRLTLEIISRTMFATGLEPADVETVSTSVTQLMHVIGQRIGRLVSIGENWPTPANRRYQGYIASLDEIIYRIIDQRRRSGLQRDDLLGQLMALKEEGQAGMTDRQLRDELMTIFLAGHETTAALLSWCLMLLSQHPAERQKVQAEVDEALAGREPSVADLPNLPYTRWVLDETLRLWPPAWVISRQALEADVIGGYPIPKGSGVLIVPYVIHRHPDYWDNPQGFDPARFSPEREKSRPPYAYLPFGGGPRLCVGNNFALQEAVLALAMVTQRYELDLASGYPVGYSIDFTLRPHNGIWMTIERRG